MMDSRSTSTEVVASTHVPFRGEGYLTLTAGERVKVEHTGCDGTPDAGSMADRVPPVAEVGRSEGRFFFDFGPEMGSRRAGRGLKMFLEAVGSILAEFEPKPSHGDPIRDQNYGFGTNS